MDFEGMILNILRQIMQEKGETIDLAYDAPGGLEGWFQVEIFKKLYDVCRDVCTEISREKPYPVRGSISDFYLKFVTGTSLWIELKVDENNKVNYARALDADIVKLNRLRMADAAKFAVLISRNNYPGSEISAFPSWQVMTNRHQYYIWIVDCRE